MRPASVLVFTILLSAIYLIYTGAFSLVEALIAIAAGAATAYALANDLVEDPSKLSPIRLLRAMKYLIKYFTVIEAAAHWGVIKLIINPRAKYSPAIVRVPYDLESEYSVVFVANSITNTPGTAVIDIDEGKRLYFVHWINAPATDEETSRKSISSEFEEHLMGVFEG